MRRRSASSTSSRSPEAWPAESLMSLKLSTSRNSTATRAAERRARSRAMCRRSRNRARLGRPVSGVVQRSVHERDLGLLALDRVPDRPAQLQRAQTRRGPENPARRRAGPRSRPHRRTGRTQRGAAPRPRRRAAARPRRPSPRPGSRRRAGRNPWRPWPSAAIASATRSAWAITIESCQLARSISLIHSAARGSGSTSSNSHWRGCPEAVIQTLPPVLHKLPFRVNSMPSCALWNVLRPEGTFATRTRFQAVNHAHP